MTYAYQPENWPAFQQELERRGIDTGDIERVEFRPTPGPATETDVTVTLRSGHVESWRHRQQPE
jgi:hypothetical protein